MPVAGLAGIGQGSDFLDAIVLKRRDTKFMFDESPLPIERHFARQIYPSERRRTRPATDPAAIEDQPGQRGRICRDTLGIKTPPSLPSQR